MTDAQLAVFVSAGQPPKRALVPIARHTGPIKAFIGFPTQPRNALIVSKHETPTKWPRKVSAVCQAFGGLIPGLPFAPESFPDPCSQSRAQPLLSVEKPEDLCPECLQESSENLKSVFRSASVGDGDELCHECAAAEAGFCECDSGCDCDPCAEHA